MEQQEVQIDEGISLVEIFRLLLSHIKFLILAVLIACVAGAGFAVFRTHDIHYYGTRATFFANPRKGDAAGDSEYGVYGTYSSSVMDGIVKLLNSGSFTEQLLLEGKALPQKGQATAKEEETLQLGLDALIDAAQVKVDDVENKEATFRTATEEKANFSKKMADSLKLLNAQWLIEYGKYPDTYKTTSFNEGIYFTALASGVASEELKAKYNDYSAAKESYAAQETLVESLGDELIEARKEMQEVVTPALKAWRKTQAYKTDLERYGKSVTFSFLGEGESLDDVGSRARSFIHVDISVLNDIDFARKLFEVVQLVVPEYVSDNMPQINGYAYTDCVKTSRNDEVTVTNPGYTVNQAIKFAALAGAATLVLACIVIILLDKSDKRLRDADTITKKFNLPVLGIIPTMEDLAEENNGKTSAKKPSKEVK